MKWLTALCGLALLAGCASDPCPRLAPELKYCLRPPASGPRGTALQEVIVSKGGQSETVLLQSENDGGRFVVVAVSPLGQTLLSAVWDGRRVDVLQAFPSLLPEPAATLAYTQFGSWPFAALASGFGDELQRTETSGAEEVLRMQDRQGRTLLAVRREARPASSPRTRIELPTTGLEIRSTLLEDRPIDLP